MSEAGSCPRCGAGLAGGAEYVVWCPGCDWNVDPSPPPPPRNWLERRSAAAADRLSQRLYQSVRQGGTRAGGAWSTAAVMALAGAVHLVTLALVAGAVLVLLVGNGPPLGLRIFFAVFLAALAVYVQPFRRVRRSHVTAVTRDRAPALFSMIDRASSAVKGPRVDQVEVYPGFNAAYSRIGRRRVVAIGMPLWAALDPQERLSVVTHELGHAVNGDLRNTRVVAYALRTLAAWFRLLRPSPPQRWRRGIRGPGSAVGLVERLLLPLVLVPLTFLIGVFGRGLAVLSNRRGQRREYYADLLAARVAGSEATATAIQKLLLGDICFQTAFQTARHRPGADPWQAVRDRLATLPQTEIERLRRRARLRFSRIDETHPPTALRAELILDRPLEAAALVVEPEQAAAIDAELAPAAAAAAERLRQAVGATELLRRQ